MKKEYRATDIALVCYEAGSMWDNLGYPSAYWRCRVAYTWSQYRHAYWVYSVQVIGFGVVDGKVTRETEMASLLEVHHYLHYLQDLEACYQKVYGE